MVKLDAAQFFKAASIQRGISRVKDLIEHVQKKSHHDAVLVYRTPRVQGKLISASQSKLAATRLGSRDYDIILFSEILDCLDLCLHEDRFLLGGLVIQRLGGWPMGGSLSEPCTMVDLNADVHKCDSSPQFLRDIGLLTDDVWYPFDQILTGVLHVDDLVAFSK
eukprot:8244518-Pyramimonas_sp.AAC.1